MAKIKTRYICQQCGADSPKWLGRCPVCNAWNSYVEEVIQPPAPKEAAANLLSGFEVAMHEAVGITDVQSVEERRMVSPDAELNRVLGGGIVPGSVILIGGEPGIGKSTLMLQLAVQSVYKVLYVSGEESAQQIKMRADRLGVHNQDCYLLTETNLYNIFKQLKSLQPDICIIDSIQTLTSPMLESAAGSVSQIRECASELQRFAKETGTPMFIVGHITKDGQIAGPKVLEHMVDTVLQFEGDQHHSYRLLRTQKNRFGSTAELGIYEMQQHGLRQVSNPSELLISENSRLLSGISIAAMLEGMRPLLVEAQALVSRSAYGTPQRSTTGFDNRRLNMLLAVLEKRSGFRFGDKDVFVNIAGGLKVEDPAIDLAIIGALLSSFEDICIPPDTCFTGEVGLSGEVRSVNRVEQRILEADKLGFKKMFMSASHKGLALSKYNIELVPVSTVEDVYEKLFK
ncbi:DNA repair protein RadA [Sphingobacteriales bacterium UPWRP_1]|nr:DNA repair protein RadA [Sphingobacteriales bacterium TSM_CSS]PSJ71685.1 DNA repair protein RadA [Sphingobacteriales bacterium UPWRP_1]